MNTFCKKFFIILVVAFLGAHGSRALAMNAPANPLRLKDVFSISAAAVVLLEISQHNPAQKNVKILGESRRAATPRNNALPSSPRAAALKKPANKRQSGGKDSDLEFCPSSSEDDKADSDLESNDDESAPSPSKKRSAASMQSNLRKKRRTNALYTYNEKANLEIRAKVTRKGTSYVCPQCKTVLKNQGSMFNHIAGHIKPYSCNKCVYTAARRHMMEVHVCKQD